MPVPASIVRLLKRFRDNYYSYKSPQYNETQLRREFVDHFFEALGWDVSNSQGAPEAYKDVIHEHSMKIEGASRSPDYAFRIGGVRKFFVETKKPSVNLRDDPSPAYQLRRYAWSAKLPVSILTDFEEFAVYDTRIKPIAGDKASIARIEYLRAEEILKNWDERIASRFSREAVLSGEFDKYAVPDKRRRGVTEVDQAFLEDIEQWRDVLARNLANRNPDLDVRDLNYAVQVTLDRIIFLRICEDRDIESERQLLEVAKNENVYKHLLALFATADDRYNSGLFHFRTEKNRAEGPDRLTPALAIDDKVLKDIIGALYFPKSPYEFSVLPSDILGQVYERFLGKVIRLTAGHRAVVEEKPEVRKAGGVYYTPTFVVRHIVERAIGSQISGKSPRQIERFRVLDPACGSGSFLLEAYQFLLDWYRDWYLANDPKKWAKGATPKLRESAGEGWRLTSTERKRILTAHIFGVDIDTQAVEVTKLSLLLKVLEGETDSQIALLHDRALPDLENNIRCGNSLIASDFLADRQADLLEDDAVLRVNPFDWESEFSSAAADGGFDSVIGNPPYVLLQDEFRDDEQLAYFRDRYAVAAYKLDTYHLFIERGLQLTKRGGVCAMITPSNFLTNNHLASLRKLILERTKVRELLVVDGGVFEGVSVDNAIFALEPAARGGTKFDISHAKPSRLGLEITTTTPIDAKSALESEHALFTGASDAGTKKLLSRIAARSVELGSIADVNFGKQLRDRKRFTKDVIEVDAAAKVPKGYRPCYTGKDVLRYAVIWNGLACLDKEEARCGGCWDASKQNAKNKLLTRQIGRVPQFGLDSNGYQCLNTIFMVSLHDAANIYAVLGQLNSKVVQAYWLDRFFDQRRTFPKIKGTYLKRLPVVPHDVKDKAQHESVARIAGLAKQLVSAHEQAARSKSSGDRAKFERHATALERRLDAEVYDLHGLSAKEIELIEQMTAAGREASAA